MPPILLVSAPSPPVATAAPPPDAVCPVCAGPLRHAGGQGRCQRCHFSFCQGCEGEHAALEE